MCKFSLNTNNIVKDITFNQNMKYIYNEKLNFNFGWQIKKLDFFDVKEKDFPSLGLFKYLYNKKINHCRLIALHASNEIAVEQFLRKRIGFLDIIKVIRNTLLSFSNIDPCNINDVFDIHEEASKISYSFINKLTS